VDSVEKYCKDYNLIIEDNNKDNRGYTKAVNDGIKKGSGEFIWLLNSDAVLKDDMSQQALIDRFVNDDKIGIVGSMQLDPNMPDRISFGGSTVCFPSGRHDGGLVSMGHCQIPKKQKWVNFASVMIRRGILEKTGLLDESMFLIYSDSSFCYTCRGCGFECWYEPRSVVFHTLKASKGVSEWHQKDMIAFMKKWGISMTPEGKFIYSDLFSKLDMFP
jgi:GT2 family glycosyltransferase